jgi:hypothetical protein
MTALTLLELLVIGCLPGAVMFRLPVLERDRRASLPAEERAYWAIVLSVATSLGLVLAMAALHRYSLQRLVVADVALSAALAAAARFDLRLGPKAKRAGLALVLPIALALFAAFRFSPPSEYIIGGKDPGVLVNAGIQIAQRGTFVYRDPVVAGVPAELRDLFIPHNADGARYIGVRFMGYFVLDPDSGAVVSQFQHVYPASIAIGHGLFGLAGALRASAFWGVFGVLAVYFLGARLFGRPAAAAAATLLTLHVAQVWFARYPNVDIVMQALLFSSLLAMARAQVDDDPFFAPVAGALFGLLLFLRYDAIVAVLATLGATALGYVSGQRARWTFFAPLAILSALCGWYLTGPLREYANLPIIFLSHLPLWQYAGLAVTAAAGVALTVAGRRSPVISGAVTKFAPLALTAVGVAAAIYALYFRHPGGRLTDYDAYSLRTFVSFYLTFPAFIAAMIGFAVVARSLFWRDPAFIVTFTTFCLLLFYKIRIVPEHFWAARRFLPIILPGMLLLAAAAALTGVRGRLLWSRALRGPIGVVFLALLAAQYARAAKPIARHIEYQGMIPKIEELATRIGDADLLIVESRDAGSDVHVLALPLAYTYARNVLVLSNAAPDKTMFAAFLRKAHDRYGRVLFLGGGGTDLLSSQWSVTPLSSERFRVPEYQSARNAYPQSVEFKDFEYTLYAFGPAGAGPAGAGLDIGVSDDLNVIRFHAKEQVDGHTFRWSQRQSSIIVNRITASDRTVAIWMGDGGRPAAAPPADVTVMIGGQTLGTVRVSGGFKEYTFDLAPDLASALAAAGEPVRLLLRTTPWNPLKLLGRNDNRDLGVMVDRVAIR